MCYLAMSCDVPSLKLHRLWVMLCKPFAFFLQGLTPKKSKSNVAAHYDLVNALYELFLDEDMQYSCAYFKTSDDALATAQQQKKDHIIRKLMA